MLWFFTGFWQSMWMSPCATNEHQSEHERVNWHPLMKDDGLRYVFVRYLARDMSVVCHLWASNFPCVHHGNFNWAISIRAKANGFNLRVRLKENFFTSPILKARHLWGSLSARARGLTAYFKLGLLQALGTATPTSNSTSVVRYSLRVHARKLWMKMKGSYMQDDHRDFASKTKPSLEKTPSLKKTNSSDS